uniref:Uncharacterized protein n=1 Tax=Sus scrofa TaxID=9823 RepID=A0A480HWI1_PIG
MLLLGGRGGAALLALAPRALAGLQSLPALLAEGGHQQGLHHLLHLDAHRLPGLALLDGEHGFLHGPDGRLLHGFLLGLGGGSCHHTARLPAPLLGDGLGVGLSFSLPARAFDDHDLGRRGGPTPFSLAPRRGLKRHLDEQLPGTFLQDPFHLHALGRCCLGSRGATPFGASPTSASSWSFSKYAINSTLERKAFPWGLIKYTSYFPAERPDFLCLSFRVQPSGSVGSSYMGPRSRMMERRCLGEAEASGTAGAEPDPSEVSALPASAGSAEWWAGGCRGSCLPSRSSFLSFFTFLNFKGLSFRPWRSCSSDFSSLSPNIPATMESCWSWSTEARCILGSHMSHQSRNW